MCFEINVIYTNEYSNKIEEFRGNILTLKKEKEEILRTIKSLEQEKKSLSNINSKLKTAKDELEEKTKKI